MRDEADTPLSDPESVIAWHGRRTPDDALDPPPSFVERLHEDDVWDTDLWWELDRALCAVAAKAAAGEAPSRKVLLAVFDLHAYVAFRIHAMRFADERHAIAGLDDHSQDDWMDRVHAVCRGVIAGIDPGRPDPAGVLKPPA